MKQVKHLAFRITNELLNQEIIIDDVQPSQIEKTVSRVLVTDLDVVGRKTHFSKRVFFDFDGTLCGEDRLDELVSTENESEVTCKRCLTSLKVRLAGRGYTLS